MINQMINLSQVSCGKPVMTHKHAMAPAGATNQYMGVLNGRFKFGCVQRRIGIPMHTSTKARRVPIDTSSPTKLIGIKPAHRNTNTPVTIVAVPGV